MNELKNNLSTHILPTSATMVGVCMTIISIVKLLHLGPSGKVVNGLFALDGLTFLISATLSYASIRSEAAATQETLTKLEAHADTAFIIGLFGMTICGFLFSFELL